MPTPPNFIFNDFADWRSPIARPFAVEIGCGVGYHPILWAKENSSGQILAIERTRSKFEKFQRRLKNHSQLQKNIFASHTDADWLLPCLFKEADVDEYYWLYPNPEPKRRNHRIAFAKLTEVVISTLVPNGRLIVATNLPEYADEVLEQLPKRFGLHVLVNELLKPTAAPRSHFEKKYIQRGEPCFSLIFQKKS